MQRLIKLLYVQTNICSKQTCVRCVISLHHCHQCVHLLAIQVYKYIFPR